MSDAKHVDLPGALERAATALPQDADSIRPANGDPVQLLRLLDGAGARRLLQWLLDHEPAAGERLASEWLEEPDCDPAIFSALDGAALSKGGRKALRRVHHRLRSRGVAVGQPATPAVVAKVGAVDESIEGAVVGPLDPHGSRVAYVVEANPTGGARIFEIVLSEDRGVQAFEVYSAAKGKARRFLKEVTTRGERPAVSAPLPAVRALIARAAAAQPADRRPPRGFSEWRKRLTNAPAGTVTPGGLAREALGEGAGSDVARALQLVREREVGPWVPDHAALHEAATQIGDLGKSELVVSAAARAEQVDGIVDAAADQIFDAGAAARVVDCFEEAAYVSWKRGREDDARACLAAAAALRVGGDEGRTVTRALLHALLEPVIESLDSAPGDSAPTEGEG